MAIFRPMLLMFATKIVCNYVVPNLVVFALVTILQDWFLIRPF